MQITGDDRISRASQRVKTQRVGPRVLRGLQMRLRDTTAVVTPVFRSDWGITLSCPHLCPPTCLRRLAQCQNGQRQSDGPGGDMFVMQTVLHKNFELQYAILQDQQLLVNCSAILRVWQVHSWHLHGQITIKATSAALCTPHTLALAFLGVFQ